MTDKPPRTSADLTLQNVKRLAALFPEVVTEGGEGEGPHIDFDLLRQALSNHVVDGPDERYRLDWPGKRRALLLANMPTNKTLRPVREDSVDFDTTRNLFIEGDNLEALKLLQESYLGKVKVIYVDPPYNTGKDFVYSDRFAHGKNEELVKSGKIDEDGGHLTVNMESNGRFHSDWLNMIYPRLKLAKNILRDDGIIIVSIDENEFHSAKIILDEIFGEESYCGEIVWKNSSKNDQDYVSVQHEYLLIYVKDKSSNKGDWKEKKSGVDQINSQLEKIFRETGGDRDKSHKLALQWYRDQEPASEMLASKHYSWVDEKGVYFPDNISGPNDGQYVYDLPHPVSNIPCKQPSRGWVCPEKEMKRRVANDEIHFGTDHTTVPNLKTYLKKTEHQNLTSILFCDSRGASQRMKRLFSGKKVFTNPKDENVLSRLSGILEVEDGDIVADIFSGSASYAHSCFLHEARKSRRIQCISIQIPESLYESHKIATGAAKNASANAIELLENIGKQANVASLAQERLRRAGAQLIEEDPDLEGNIDIGFRTLRIDSASFEDAHVRADMLTQSDIDGLVFPIKHDRTDEDLLFHALLRFAGGGRHASPLLTLPIRRVEVSGRSVFLVDPQADTDEGAALLACFATPTGDAGGIDRDLGKALASLAPLRAVFRDDGFVDDATKENVHSLFTQLAPETEVRVL